MKTAATHMLKEDHEKVKELFKRLESKKSFTEKKSIFQLIAAELKVHTTLEEEIFYPAVREEIDDDELMDEAVQEHHVCDVLIEEIEGMNPAAEEEKHEYLAKVKVLQENVEHHIEEEEGEMFPEVNKTKMDQPSLEKRMKARKQQLEQQEKAA
jgi:hemerythrin-like domain-containing protein